MKKALIIIAAVFIGLIALVIVGGIIGPQEQAPAPPVNAVNSDAQDVNAEPAPRYTDEEQEIIDYVSAHIDDMEDLLLEIEVVANSGADYATLSRDVLKLANQYKRLETSYMETNGGEYAGGEVEQLEALWESIGNNVRVTVRIMLQIVSEPDKANVDRAVAQYTAAVAAMPVLREELETLRSY